MHNFSRFISFVIYRLGGIDYAGTMAVAAGWGRTGERESVSNALRKVDLPILSDEECRMAGYNKKRLTENMFCAGYLDGQRDACQVITWVW